jgi:hypothetical protein
MGDGEVGTVRAGGGISVLGETGSLASAFVAPIKPAITDTVRIIGIICLIHIMSDHIPLLIEYSAIRD